MRYDKKSDNCQLANVKVEGYDLDFTKTNYEYKLKLPQPVKSLSIDYLADDDKSGVEITGNENLKNNSKITILVTSESGKECEYIIQIKKSSNIWKIFLLLFILIILLVLALGTLYKFKIKGTGKYRYE